MARARQIKPGLYKNEDMAECSFPARYLFPGLWTLADRAGRLEDRPKRIKGELLPYDSVEVEPLLQELAQWGFIHRYEVNGLKVIWIPKFRAHQNPHKNEKESELPPHPEDDSEQCSESSHVQAPEEHGASTVQAPEEHGASTVQAPEEHGASTRGARWDSGLLPLTSSLLPSGEEDLRPPLPPPPASTPVAEPVPPRQQESRGGLEEAGIEENPDGIGTHEWDGPIELLQLAEIFPEDRRDLGAAEIALKALSKMRKWPGMVRVMDDLAKRTECELWTRDERRFMPNLSKYIREMQWKNPIPSTSRASPVGRPEDAAVDDIANEFRKGKRHEISQTNARQLPSGAQAPGTALSSVKAGHNARSPGRGLRRDV